MCRIPFSTPLTTIFLFSARKRKYRADACGRSDGGAAEAIFDIVELLIFFVLVFFR